MLSQSLNIVLEEYLTNNDIDEPLALYTEDMYNKVLQKEERIILKINFILRYIDIQRLINQFFSIMDNGGNNGGAGPNSGRKPKLKRRYNL